MPKDIEKLHKKIKQLSDALCRQSNKRHELEQATIKETTKILTEISKIVDREEVDPTVRELGLQFFKCCPFRPGGILDPVDPVVAKKPR